MKTFGECRVVLAQTFGENSSNFWREKLGQHYNIGEPVDMLSRLGYAGYGRDVYRRDYNVSDVFYNDFDAITSRLFFIQLHEPSSMYAL